MKCNTCTSIAQIMDVNFNTFSQSIITSYSKANQCYINYNNVLLHAECRSKLSSWLHNFVNENAFLHPGLNSDPDSCLIVCLLIQSHYRIISRVELKTIKVENRLLN